MRCQQRPAIEGPAAHRDTHHAMEPGKPLINPPPRHPPPPSSRREPPLTSKTPTFAGCLDYIWLSPQHMDVLRTLEMPYEHPARGRPWRDPLIDIAFPPIPNEDYPSDHLALAAEIRLKVPGGGKREGEGKGEREGRQDGEGKESGRVNGANGRRGKGT